MEKINIELYHCTERANALSIIDTKFTAHYHDEHWLGNGIYFFQDKDLAKWWAKNNAKKYAPPFKDPVILKIKLNISKNKILDLRTLQDYKFCADLFKDYLSNLIQMLGSGAPVCSTKLICMFFDMIRIKYGYEVIIGTFYRPEQSYLGGVSNEISNYNGLNYVETQVCLSENLANKCKNTYTKLEEIY